MMTQKMLDDAIAGENYNLKMSKQHSTDRKANMRRRSNLISKLEFKTGLDLIQSSYAFRHDRAIELSNVSDLHEIKKVTGEVTEYGQDVANDFDKTNEIVITVKPEKGLYEILKFSYRRELKATDKCQVVQQTDPSFPYNALICDK